MAYPKTKKQLEAFTDKQRKRICSLSNIELFDSFLDASQPDDYDGCFTDAGHILFSIHEKELRNRLADWLKQ